jgi:hypothetical protein
MTKPVGFPKLASPFVEAESGYPSRPWWEFLRGLWLRTSGGNVESVSANRNAVDQAGVASGVYTRIAFTTVDWSVGGTLDTTVNVGRWTPGDGGRFYHLDAAVQFTAMTDGALIAIAIFKNGANWKQTQQITGAATSPGVSISCDVLLELDTDYLEVFAFQNSGSPQAIAGTKITTWFQGRVVLS